MLRILWSDFSVAELDHIFNYYKLHAGQRIANKLLRKIVLEAEQLKRFPEIGQLEPMLLDRSYTYRYLVCGNYKIIYTFLEDDNVILIADVFDARQHPPKLSRGEV